MEKKPNNNNNKRNPLNYVPYIIVSLFIIMMFFTNPMSGTTKALDYSTFMNKVNAGEIVSASVTVDQNTLSVSGTCLDGENKIAYTATVPNTDYQTDTLMETLKSKGVKASVSDADASSIFTALLTTVLPLVLFMGVGLFFINRMQGASGNKQAFDFSKSRARLEDNIKVRFADVAGCDEEKEEMAEIIDYLKSPRKFAAMGARIPKGILLSGSPGTGKTLLAKAVAGEANVPFYSISGSDFVEMFVGVGASRVRDMFAKAKKTAPCMIFIDEIDAVGRQRGAGMGGGHDEREQTLNQLPATNRPDVLDPALLRPGRFDRQITVSLPDLNGRKAILAVHARNKKLADDVDLEALARRTPGFSGADLENVLNEAAILTVRENKQIIGLSELDEAIDRVMMGPAKKSRTYDEHTKKLVAYHEAGHAIVGLNLPDGAIVQKITIIPRGSAGGYNLITPRKEKILNSRKELIDTITSYMGGRTAEEVFFDDITTGASNDIQQATRIAKDMVKVYGMSELGPIQYDSGEQSIFLGRDYNSPSNASSQVAYEIDQAVRQIIDECHETARKIILEHKSDLVKIAEALIANETITAEEIQDILNDKLVVRDGKLVKAEEVETITDINEPEVVDAEVKPKRTRKKKVTEEKGDNDKAA